MPTNFPFDISQVRIHCLQNGGIVIFPTETIYGIGCSALCDDSILRIFKIKGRMMDQAPPILISDDSQLSTLITKISPFAKTLMEEYWPGALTIVLPARDEISEFLCSLSPDKSQRTIAIRRTAHPIARALCEKIGTPFIATSANFSGATGRAAAPQSLDDIPVEFKNQVDVIVNGGAVGGVPSTIVDCVSVPPRILRSGAISIKELTV